MTFAQNHNVHMREPPHYRRRDLEEELPELQEQLEAMKDELEAARDDAKYYKKQRGMVWNLVAVISRKFWEVKGDAEYLRYRIEELESERDGLREYIKTIDPKE